ncbi:2973_t:CDS:2 [Ambispora gerdemannii]|uniref:2973_t:CDS:1 n=1 Tax=Ambispora gerdemannii TaxID=144530 RepID=A0A9N9AK82_9GLOM|nr:2973_t:CDS:2 [Ambispora gerdemannii]
MKEHYKFFWTEFIFGLLSVLLKQKKHKTQLLTEITTLEQNPTPNQTELEAKKKKLRELQDQEKQLSASLPLTTQISILEREIKELENKSIRTQAEETFLTSKKKELDKLLKKQDSANTNNTQPSDKTVLAIVKAGIDLDAMARLFSQLADTDKELVFIPKLNEQYVKDVVNHLCQHKGAGFEDVNNRPLQPNADDCGVYLLGFTRLLSEKPELLKKGVGEMDSQKERSYWRDKRPKASELDDILGNWINIGNKGGSKHQTTSFDENSEIYRQYEKAEEHNKTLPKHFPDTKYEFHLSAVYTSCLLDFKNLPQPQNSKEINENFYSKQIVQLLQNLEKQQQALELEIKNIENKIKQPLTGEQKDLVREFIKVRKEVAEDKKDETET